MNNTIKPGRAFDVLARLINQFGSPIRVTSDNSPEPWYVTERRARDAQGIK